MFKSELIYVCHSSIFFSLSTPQSCQKSECSIAFVFLSFQKGLENEHTYSVLHSLFRAFLRDKILAKSLRILAFPNYIKAPKNMSSRQCLYLVIEGGSYFFLSFEQYCDIHLRSLVGFCIASMLSIFLILCYCKVKF